MSSTLSVVIAAKNSESRIVGTVKPWLSIAKEVIVVDQNSTDRTAVLAQELGCKVIRNDPPGNNFDINRKVGLLKATSDWILYIDTDERPTSEMLVELKTFLSSEKQDIDGVKIPNYFYFLGRRLRYGIYNSNSAEIRMFRRGKWSYNPEDGFHRGVSVDGKVFKFTHGYRHFNVNSLSEWFIKTNQYTELDAEKKSKNQSPRILKNIWNAYKFFMKHYFFKRGFLDGYAGFLSCIYFMLYHFTLEAKIWEKQQLQSLEIEKDYLVPFRDR